MRKFIIGFVFGSLVSGTFVFAALPEGRNTREFNKFVADSSGNTTVRIVFTQ